MKLVAYLVGEKKKDVLIDSGNGPLECRISEVLPGWRVVGIFMYPSLSEISIHVVREEQ